jgi:polysaccharide transporter, PST family
VIGTMMALASHAIIRILYSKSYSGAAPILAVHLWASVFVFLGIAQTPWDLSKNLMKLALYRVAAGAAINIALNFILIPRYSAMGAAIATVIAYAAAVLANAFSAKTRPILWMQIQSFIPTKFWNITE